MTEGFWLSFWGGLFILTIIFTFLLLLGSELKNWIDRFWEGAERNTRAKTEILKAQSNLEAAKTQRIKAEQEAAEAAYLRALREHSDLRSKVD